jgi:hypothetical protein
MNIQCFRSLAGLRSVFAMVLAASVMTSVHAIDTDPGDWTAPPPGINLFLLYAQHANRNALYANGQQTLNAKLASDVAILRYVRPVDVSGFVVAPQVLLPLARLRTGGVVAGLGNASGTGDLILASPIWLTKADAASRNSFSFAPYLVLPTGDYVTGRALNIGESRWKAIFQFGGTYQLSEQIDAEGAIDATLFGKNKKFGTSGADTLKQELLYQLPGSLTWHQSPGTLFAVSLSHTFGGLQKVNGVSLNNEMTTTKMTLTASTFVTPSVQVLGSVGRDLKVENGFKESSRLNVRLLKVF